MHRSRVWADWLLVDELHNVLQRLSRRVKHLRQVFKRKSNQLGTVRKVGGEVPTQVYNKFVDGQGRGLYGGWGSIRLYNLSERCELYLHVSVIVVCDDLREFVGECLSTVPHWDFGLLLNEELNDIGIIN